MSETFTYDVTTRPRDRFGKARVYVFGAEEPNIELPAPKFKGEDPENDKAYRDFNRKFAANMKAYAILAQENGEVPNAKLRFSAKAGCSCPCSPGFILDKHSSVDYYITVIHSEG
jgi:hypothetical protein